MSEKDRDTLDLNMDNFVKRIFEHDFSVPTPGLSGEEFAQLPIEQMWNHDDLGLNRLLWATVSTRPRLLGEPPGRSYLRFVGAVLTQPEVVERDAFGLGWSIFCNDARMSSPTQDLMEGMEWADEEGPRRAELPS